MNEPAWLEPYRLICTLQVGEAVTLTHEQMAALVKTNRSGFDLALPVTDRDIFEATQTWGMFADFLVAHDAMKGEWQVFLPDGPPEVYVASNVPAGKCRVCGCTESRACVSPGETGDPMSVVCCHWAEAPGPDGIGLCSDCAGG